MPEQTAYSAVGWRLLLFFEGHAEHIARIRAIPCCSLPPQPPWRSSCCGKTRSMSVSLWMHDGIITKHIAAKAVQQKHCMDRTVAAAAGDAAPSPQSMLGPGVVVQQHPASCCLFCCLGYCLGAACLVLVTLLLASFCHDHSFRGPCLSSAARR